PSGLLPGWWSIPVDFRAGPSYHNPRRGGHDPPGGTGMTRGPLHILLTGAASGLGRGLALYFAGKGHRLVLADRNPEGLRETVGLLGDATERASAHVVDVTSAAQVRDLLAALGGEPVELLINDAGLQHVARVEDFPEERWDLLVGVMLKGPFLLAQAVLPGM